MQSEGLRIWVERKGLDVVKVVLLIAGWERVVKTTLRELVSLGENVSVNVALQDGPDQSDILPLRHSASIVNLCTKHVQHFEGDVIVRFHEFLELSSAHDEIFVSEGVRDVPSNWAELSPILHDSVEEAESKEELLEDFWLRALFKLLWSEGLVGLQNVRLES